MTSDSKTPDLRLLVFGAVSLALFVTLAPAAAQKRSEVGQRELKRTMPGGSVAACSLITRAEVEKAAGRNPYVDPEPYGDGGWICNVGVGELKIYSGPKSWDSWESTLKAFKKDKEPRTPATGFGERGYFLYPKPDNEYQGNAAMLVAKKGNHTVVLSLDAPKGKPAESMRPGLETLMKSILGRLPG